MLEGGQLLSRLPQGLQAQIIQLLDNDTLLSFMSTCHSARRSVFDAAEGIRAIITHETQVETAATLFQDVPAARLSLQVQHPDQLAALCQLRALGVEAKELCFRGTENEDIYSDDTSQYFQLGGARAALAADACLGVKEVALCCVALTDGVFFTGLASVCGSMEKLRFTGVEFADLVQDSPKNVHGLADLAAHLPASCEVEVEGTLPAPFAANPMLLAHITSLAAGPRGGPAYHTDPEDEEWYTSYAQWEWREPLCLMASSFHGLRAVNLKKHVLTPALVKALSACPQLKHIRTRAVSMPKGGGVCTNERPPALQCLTVQLQYINYIAKLPWLAQVPELRLEGLSFWTCNRHNVEETAGAVAGEVEQAAQMLVTMPCLRLGMADGTGMTVSMESWHEDLMPGLLGALAPLARIMPHTVTIHLAGLTINLAFALGSVFGQCRTLALRWVYLSMPFHTEPIWSTLLEELPHLSKLTVRFNMRLIDSAYDRFHNGPPPAYDEDTSDGLDFDGASMGEDGAQEPDFDGASVAEDSTHGHDLHGTSVGEDGAQEPDLHGASVDEDSTHGHDAHGAGGAEGSLRLQLDALTFYTGFAAEFEAACISLGRQVKVCVEDWSSTDEYGHSCLGLSDEQAAALDSEYVHMQPREDWQQY